MNYEPRGKVAALISAMRERPQKEFWTSQEVALEMDVHQASLTAHLGAAIRHGALHRRMDGNGRCQYSVKPFPIATAPGGEVNGFVPAQMVAPRPSTDTPRPTLAPAQPLEIPRFGSPSTPEPTEAPAPAPAPAEPEIDERFAAAHYGHDLYVGTRPGDGIVGSCAAPKAEPVQQPESEEEEEQIQPDAFLSVQTGDWTLVGCEVDEEGRVTVPAALMAKIKAQMVWSVLR